MASNWGFTNFLKAVVIINHNSAPWPITILRSMIMLIWDFFSLNWQILKLISWNQKLNFFINTLKMDFGFKLGFYKFFKSSYNHQPQFCIMTYHHFEIHDHAHLRFFFHSTDNFSMKRVQWYRTRFYVQGYRRRFYVLGYRTRFYVQGYVFLFSFKNH